jgi:hypothetical protein
MARIDLVLPDARHCDDYWVYSRLLRQPKVASFAWRVWDHTANCLEEQFLESSAAAPSV